MPAATLYGCRRWEICWAVGVGVSDDPAISVWSGHSRWERRVRDVLVLWAWVRVVMSGIYYPTAWQRLAAALSDSAPIFPLLEHTPNPVPN